MMFKNIKLIGVIFLAMLLLTNCKKENQDNNQSPGELVFAPYDAGNEKDGEFDVLCDESLIVTHARVQLNGVFYYPATFELDGKLYTQSIKLDPGSYTINEFSLMADPLNTPNDHSDDAVVKSTPMYDSEYAMYVTNPIDEDPDFTIVAFEKNEYAIDVLCYLPAEYDEFGFEWFEVTPITIREQCFFGDFCIKDPNQYSGSLYGPNVVLDEVAIFKIVVYHDGELVDSYYNTSYVDNVLVYSSPLCVEYADYDMKLDEYDFELWIYVTSGNSWDYVKFHTWNFYDDDMIASGDDGVVDFVLGNCVSSFTDLLLPPWMNLPGEGDYIFSLTNGGFQGDAYWDMTFSGIGSANYDMQNGTYPGWCADEFTTIGNGIHCMDALSSLYPDMLPPYWLNDIPAGPNALTKKQAICAANWLWNNEANYAPYTVTEMQHALWNLFNNKVVTGDALEMATDARMHLDYSPLPGGWAAIFFVPCNDAIELQMTFFVVDP